MSSWFSDLNPCHTLPWFHGVLHSDLKFHRAPWDSTKILENKANNFTFSITWSYHGTPTTIMAFLRSVHSVLPFSHRILVGNWLRGHRALMASSWRAKSCHNASTVCTQRIRRVQWVSMAPAQHLRNIAPGVLQKSWSCIYTGVVLCDTMPNYWRHFLCFIHSDIYIFFSCSWRWTYYGRDVVYLRNKAVVFTWLRYLTEQNGWNSGFKNWNSDSYQCFLKPLHCIPVSLYQYLGKILDVDTT